MPARRTATTWAVAASLAAAPFAPWAPRAAWAAEPAGAAEETPRTRADAHLREAAAAGQAGDWDGAIAAFRKAEALFPRAIHDCNIGLAFMRSGRPHLAWTYLGRCQVRATDALPSWVDTMRRDALTEMRAGAYAPVEITATPPSLYVSVDALPDETFAPTASPGAALATLVLWLPHGSHTLRFGAPDHVPEVRSVDVAGRETTRLSVALGRTPQPVARDPDPRPEPQPPSDAEQPARPAQPIVEAPSAVESPGPSLTSWLVLGSGLAVFAASFFPRSLATEASERPQRDQIPEGDPRFDAAQADYERYNSVWVAMAVGGGILMAAGGTMMSVELTRGPQASSVGVAGPGSTRSFGALSLSPLPGGGALSLRGAF